MEGLPATTPKFSFSLRLNSCTRVALSSLLSGPRRHRSSTSYVSAGSFCQQGHVSKCPSVCGGLMGAGQGPGVRGAHVRITASGLRVRKDIWTHVPFGKMTRHVSGCACQLWYIMCNHRLNPWMWFKVYHTLVDHYGIVGRGASCFTLHGAGTFAHLQENFNNDVDYWILNYFSSFI